MHRRVRNSKNNKNPSNRNNLRLILRNKHPSSELQILSQPIKTCDSSHINLLRIVSHNQSIKSPSEIDTEAPQDANTFILSYNFMSSLFLFVEKRVELLLPSDATEYLLSLELRKQLQKYFNESLVVWFVVLLKLQFYFSHVETLTHHSSTDVPHMLFLFLVVVAFLRRDLFQIDFLQKFEAVMNLCQLMRLQLRADTGLDVGQVKPRLSCEIFETCLQNSELAGKFYECHHLHTNPFNFLVCWYLDVVGHTAIYVSFCIT